MDTALYSSDIKEFPLIRKGKVREVYDLGTSILFVASDRISAFDVIMGQPVPGKGKILSGISEFWFNHTREIINNHFITSDINFYPEELFKYKDVLNGRSMIVRKAEPMPIEFVVRGYLAGSGWKEYQKSGTVCGIPLPSGLVEFSPLPEPIFTPSTKAETGHDQNIGPDECAEIIGKETSDYLAAKAVELYKYAAGYLEKRGIILADTKFEFGRLPDGELILIDEALTPDSSRFWLKEDYAPGKEQMNFDKQVLRDYLLSIDWDKNPPPPVLPDEVIRKTYDKYLSAYNRIIG